MRQIIHNTSTGIQNEIFFEMTNAQTISLSN